MHQQSIMDVLQRVKSGELAVEQALERLRHLPYQDLGFAKVDHHRVLRQGFPEVVLGQGKSPEQVATIVESLAGHSPRLLITRASPEIYAAVKAKIPEATYNAVARAVVLDRLQQAARRPGVMVLSGGTVDMSVAEEAAVTADLLGSQVVRVYDVGIAGIHRLLDHLSQLQQARVIVVVAGMEGALPSVVSGLVSAPVIAVPTSAGYGASFGGLAPLLAMLNSCSAGVAVVNIDNGFGAGYIAGLINSLS
ncbi:MAG: nickel pincer cofactor biosynthesis protein LarB [Chloroflexi bacterium]|nr:nickel pincer cofactor biosynthesis protein LarB [Chloroflexota bacterium]